MYQNYSQGFNIISSFLKLSSPFAIRKKNDKYIRTSSIEKSSNVLLLKSITNIRKNKTLLFSLVLKTNRNISMYSLSTCINSNHKKNNSVKASAAEVATCSGTSSGTLFFS